MRLEGEKGRKPYLARPGGAGGVGGAAASAPNPVAFAGDK